MNFVKKGTSSSNMHHRRITSQGSQFSNQMVKSIGSPSPQQAYTLSNQNLVMRG